MMKVKVGKVSNQDMKRIKKTKANVYKNKFVRKIERMQNN